MRRRTSGAGVPSRRRPTTPASARRRRRPGAPRCCVCFCRRSLFPARVPTDSRVLYASCVFPDSRLSAAMLHRPAQAHGRTATIGARAIPEDRDATVKQGPCTVRSLVGTVQGRERAQVQAPRLRSRRYAASRIERQVARPGGAQTRHRMSLGTAGPALRAGPLVRAADLPGHGCRRQGRCHRARLLGRQPARLPGHVVQGALVRGARSRLPLALQPRTAGARPHRYLQPLVLRGSAGRARARGDPGVRRNCPPASSARRSGGSVTRTSPTSSSTSHGMAR